MTTMITGTAGIISHGVMATVWTFWACCSRTPQLIAGSRGRSPLGAPTRRSHSWRLAHAQPDEGNEHDERAQAEDEIGGAPAVPGDQPLCEQADRQHARPHAREGQAQHAAPPLGEPA